MSYSNQVKYIQELAREIKSQGFIVYIASAGNYGFFTDTEGKSVVCFGFNDGYTLSFSGNYKALKASDAKYIGSGWRLPDGLTFNEMLNALPPQWATKDIACKKVTLSEHFARYQLSSNYTEF